MQKVKLKKLNIGYQSDPNIGKSTVELSGKDLILSFNLNYFIFKFKEGDKGIIQFKNYYAFRVGVPNDEGFDLNEHLVWNKKNLGHIEWDSFYEVLDNQFDNLKDFQKTKNNSMDKTKLHHYIFFMKEATFECYAESYNEKISKQ